MAFQYQLTDLKNDLSIKAVAGSCSSSADFLSLANTVIRRLMKRGNFYETEWLMKLCVHGCRIAWPRIIGTVLGARFCGKSEQSAARNIWWSIIGQRSCRSNWNSDVIIREGNTAPTFSEIHDNTGKLIRYYVVKNADIGKTITLYGTKFGGQPLQELVDGVWQDGLTITAAAPFATTTVLVTKITSVVRQATQGMAYLYEYDAAEDQMIDLAAYEPNETNPRYRTSIIENVCAVPSCEDANGVQVRTVEALVKLQWRPLVNDWDFLMMDDFDAIGLGMQAIKLEQANDVAGAEAMWLSAVRELNFGTRDKQPELQTAIRVNVFGDGSVPMYNPI